MKNYWNKIHAYFEEEAIEVISTFNEGATAEDFSKLKAVFNYDLPKDFVAFYKVHNGQNTGLVFNSAIIDPESEGLSSIDKIIATYELYQQLSENAWGLDPQAVDQGIKAMFWNPAFLPIMEDGMGNSYFIDLDPDEGGTMGQIILRISDGPSYELIAKSFRQWVKEYVDGNLD